MEAILGWVAGVMLVLLILLFVWPRSTEPEVAPEAMSGDAAASATAAEPDGSGEVTRAAASAGNASASSRGGGGAGTARPRPGPKTKLTAAAPAPAPAPGTASVAAAPSPSNSGSSGTASLAQLNVTDDGGNPVEAVLAVERAAPAPAPSGAATTASAPVPAPVAPSNVFRIGPDGLREAIESRRPALQACFEALRGSNPEVPTRIMATLAIERVGDVGRVVNVYFNREAAPMQSCAEAALSQVAFEPPPLRTNAGWPIDFQ